MEYICKRCGKNQNQTTFEDFVIERQPKSPWCKKCRTEYKREWRASAKASGHCTNCSWRKAVKGKTLCEYCAKSLAKNISAYHRRTKEAAFNAYGGPVCACCGDTHFEFMSIDHMDGKGSEHRKVLRGGDGYGGGGGMRLYLWLKRNNYPSGYRVLCRNCNCAFGELGYCPHERERLDAAGVPTSP